MKSETRAVSVAEASLLAFAQDFLHFEHRIEVPVKCVHGSLYVRISCHIYNQLADYEKLAAAVQAISAAQDAS